jgi:ABC-type uncharacterized transport system involved in gliding motility auxiliary subunit
MATQEQKRKAAAQTGAYLLIITAIIVVANLLSVGKYGRFDWTKSERYTLSQGSARLVESLKAPIQVDAYITKGSAQLDAFVRDLVDLLKEYERGGKGKFKFTLIEAKTEEQREAAKEAGLQEMALIEANKTDEDQASIAQGYMGLVLKYGSEKGVIPQLHPSRAEGLEFWITNKVREVRDKADDIKHKIGVVTGKDELKLSDQNLVPKQGKGGSPSIQTILEQAFPFYKMEEVTIAEDKEIDKDFVGLIITQPRKDYTEKELRRVDEFLMRGGKSLVVLASAVTLKPQDATMSASLELHGLDKLLLGYGIDMKKNAVLDFGAQFRLPIVTQTGAVSSIRHPGIAHVVNDPRFSESEKPLDAGFAAFFRMDELAFPFPSSLELLPDKQPKDGVKIYAVARTTTNATVLTDATIDMKLKPDWKPKPPYKQHIIAAVSEGKLKSSFAGAPAEGIKPNERAPQDSRVLVIASSQFVTNPFAFSGNGPDLGGQFAMFGAVGGDPQLQMIAQPYAQRYLTATILSVKNTLDWMSGDTDLLATSAKIIGEPNLTYSSIKPPKIEAEDDEAAIKKKDDEYKASRKQLQTAVQWSLTIGMPLFFALFGLIRWRMREGQRDQVKL